MSSPLKSRKKTIFITATIFLFFFFAPFYHTPGGRENLLEEGYSNYTEPNSYTIISVWEYYEDFTWPCNGSCIYYDTTWAPFGALVRNYSKNAFYVTPLWKIEIEDTSKIPFIAPPLSTQNTKKTSDLKTIGVYSNVYSVAFTPMEGGDPVPNALSTIKFYSSVNVILKNESTTSLENLKISDMELYNHTDKETHKISPEQYIKTDQCNPSNNDSDKIDSFTIEPDCEINLRLEHSTEKHLFYNPDIVSLKFKISNDTFTTSWIKSPETVSDNAF